MNKLFKQLKDDNLLLPIEGKRGKYELTEKAIIIIKDMEKLEPVIPVQNNLISKNFGALVDCLSCKLYHDTIKLSI